MGVEVQHDGPAKFALAGLDLNVPVDLVPVAKYSRATNVVSKIEGQLQTRNGTALITALPSPFVGLTYPITSAVRNLTLPPQWTAPFVPFFAGTVIQVTGCSNPSYNGIFTVNQIVFSGTTFTTSNGSIPASSSSTGGLITVLSGPTGPVNTLFLLTQYVPGVVSERLAANADGNIYTAPLPGGNVFTQLLGGPTFDGSPLSIVQFRFDSDPAVWAIIANANGMMKRRAGYYQVLGVAPPTLQAVATAGGAGLLNSSTGTPYDWRYTYLNPVTQSESNPSPIMVTPTVTRPTAFTNPAVVGDGAFTNPGNAIDGSATTFATGVATTSTIGATVTTDCLWRAAAANAIGILQTLTLNLNRSFTLVQSGFGQGTYQSFYSLDGGVTFTGIDGGAGTFPQGTVSVSLPPGTDFTQIVVKTVITAHVRITGAGSATSTGKVFDINLSAVGVNGTVLTLALTNQSANVCITPPTDPQETSARLYRRGGTLPNNWFFVGEFSIASLVQGSCGAGTLLINDNVPDSVAQVGNILQIDNFQPIQSVQAVNFPLPVIFVSSGTGRLLGCGDPARPDAVYFSNAGNADLWGAEAWVVVANPGEQCMNGLDYNLRTFVFSRERMYIMLPNIVAGVTFTPAETACRRGLKGRWAFTAGEQGIYFVSKDGIYRTQGGPESSIIDDSIRPLFPVNDAEAGTPTNGYDAIDMDDEDGLRMAYHNGEVWFFYTGLTTGLRQILIYDERRSRWRPATYTNQMNMNYSEPNTDSSLIFGGTDGDVYQVSGSTDEGNAPIPVEITTGAFDQGRPLNLKEYLTVNFDVDPGGASNGSPIVVIPRINGETASEFALQITGSGRQRVTLPLNQAGVEVYAYNMEFDILWQGSATVNPIFYQYEIHYRHEPTETTHWELPQSSMGMEGWFHIRDMYIVLRSSAPVTLTVTPGVAGAVPLTFTLPSTNGAKDTLYVQLPMNKANSYAFALDSTAPFRVYAEDCEVRVKQWLTNLGYKNVPILSREQVGRPFGVVNV